MTTWDEAFGALLVMCEHGATAEVRGHATTLLARELVARLNTTDRNHNFPFRIPSQTPGAALETVVGVDRHFAFAHQRASESGFSVVPSGEKIAALYRLRSPGPGHFWQGSVPQVPGPQSVYDAELAAVIAETEDLIESSFEPTMLGDPVLWIDLQDSAARIVTPGSPPHVGTVINKASDVAWVEVTNPPEYDADGLNGLPCMKGNGTNMRIASTEAAVRAALAGEDAPFSLYAVIETDGSTQVWFEGSSLVLPTPGYVSALLVAGDQKHELWKQASGGGLTAEVSSVVVDAPSVVSWISAGQTLDGHLDLGDADPSAADFDAGEITIDSVALLSEAGTPSIFSPAKVGELLLYPVGHSMAQRRMVQRYMLNRWGLL